MIALAGDVVVVHVIMIVPIQSEGTTGSGTEQGAVFRTIRNNVGRSVTTDMTVEANHAIRGTHHHMQLVACLLYTSDAADE